MANNRTITAANAIILLGATGLFDTAQRIEGFAADNITDMDAYQPTETLTGVDGRLSAGWAFAPVPQNITLQADSASNDFFDTLISAEETAREKYVLFGSIVLPATNRKYSMTRGFLTNIVKLPAVAKVLQPRKFTVLWQRVQPAAN